MSCPLAFAALKAEAPRISFAAVFLVEEARTQGRLLQVIAVLPSPGSDVGLFMQEEAR